MTQKSNIFHDQSANANLHKNSDQNQNRDIMKDSSEVRYRIYKEIEFIPARNALKKMKSGRLTKIEPLLSKVLVFLIKNRTRTIPRTELQDKFWPSDVLSDDALTKAISKNSQVTASTDLH